MFVAWLAGLLVMVVLFLLALIVLWLDGYDNDTVILLSRTSAFLSVAPYSWGIVGADAGLGGVGLEI